MSLVFLFQSSSSPSFLASLLTQSSHLSLGLHRFLLPSSRNSAAFFRSLSSAILSTCPAHCILLLTNLSVKLLCTPVSSLNSIIILLSALVTLAKQPTKQGNSWVKAATPSFCGSLPSDCIVSKNCTKWFAIITSF